MCPDHLRPAARIVLAVLLTIGGAQPTHANGSEDNWYSVHLDGRKIGRLHTSRALEGEDVRSTQSLQLAIERSGETLRIASRESTLESVDGRPLSFTAELDTAGSRSRLEGHVHDGVAEVRIERAEGALVHRFDWPQGALLSEGQRLATLAAGIDVGSRSDLLAFDLASLRAIPVQSEVLGVTTVDVHGQPERLLALRQRLGPDGASVRIDSWVEVEGLRARRMLLPVLGLSLDVQACSQACAEAPDQPADVFAGTVIAAPRALGRREAQRPLRYRLRVDGGESLPLPNLPGQSSSTDGNRLLIEVDPRGGVDRAPEQADLAPNRWLQSDHPRLQAMAAAAVEGTSDTLGRMRRLQAAVRAHIEVKSLRVGYASALDVLDHGEGDCTEHAVLLAALARALGIPARVATGLAYTERFDGRRDVFVPHAWVYAWVDGRWQGFDAALSRFDARHLVLDAGDGDPFRFYAGVALLGRLSIESIEKVAR